MDSTNKPAPVLPADLSPVRVTIRFTGRLAGALGIGYEITERRTLKLPAPFTEEQAKEAARVNLYEKQGDSPAYESVTIRSIAFN